MTSANISKFSDDVLMAICSIVGDTDTGLTGSEIGEILWQLGVEDPEPKQTKRKRLYNTLSTRQELDQSGEIVIEFLRRAYSRPQYVCIADECFPRDQFWRRKINQALQSTPYAIDSKGQLRPLRNTILIKTLNDTLEDYNFLFFLWFGIDNFGELDMTFDFSRCGFLRQNAVAFLGGLARLIEHRRGKCRFDWQSLRSDVGLNLAKNCFRDLFGDPTAIGAGNSIPYREDKTADKTAIMGYLKHQWLGRGWVNVSQALRDAIVGRVWEIYANAFEHGGSPIGVFSCGQYYPRQRQLHLTVVDFGVGIPANVREFLRDDNLSAQQALEWAFRPGHSTKSNEVGRGMGLDLLSEFVSVNGGRLEVFSDDGYARIDGGGANFTTTMSFRGTLLTVCLKCDDKQYCLTEEVPKMPLF